MQHSSRPKTTLVGPPTSPGDAPTHVLVLPLVLLLLERKSLHRRRLRAAPATAAQGLRAAGSSLVHRLAVLDRLEQGAARRPLLLLAAVLLRAGRFRPLLLRAGTSGIANAIKTTDTQV